MKPNAQIKPWILGGLFALIAAPSHAGTPANPIIPPPLRNLGRDYKIRLVYFVPNNRAIKNYHRDKIEVLMRVVADIYKRAFKSNGYATRGLDFEFDPKGQLKVHLVKGKHKSIHYTGKPYKVDHYIQTTTQEIIANLGAPDRRAHLIFSEAGGIAEAQPAFPYCGFAMVSADMLRDEVTATTIEKQIDRFFDPTPIRKVDGGQKVPRSQTVQTTNGVLIHELGHIFFMLHDTVDSRNIMAYGYHHLAKMYDPKTAMDRPVRFSKAHVRIASASRFLSESFDESDTKAPKINLQLAKPPQAGGTEIVFKLSASDDKKLHAAICLQRGGGQVDALVGSIKMENKKFDQLVKFKCPRPLVANQPLIFILNVIDANGNAAQLTRRSMVAAK